MHSKRDLKLVDPSARLRQTLADLDALAVEDEGRRRRIDGALCHLQLAIDLLDQAQVTDT